MRDKELPKDTDGIIRYIFDLLSLELVVSRITQHISHDIL